MKWEWAPKAALWYGRHPDWWKPQLAKIDGRRRIPYWREPGSVPKIAQSRTTARRSHERPASMQPPPVGRRGTRFWERRPGCARPVLNKLKNEGAQAILMYGQADTTPIVARQMLEMGLAGKVMLVGNGQFNTKTTIAAAWLSRLADPTRSISNIHFLN
jgi:hypothetical protein